MFAAPMSKENKDERTETFTRQGSLRRVIPPPETNQENLFGRQNEDLNRIFKIYRQEYIILAEYKMIETEDIQGVYVIPSRENSLIWFGTIFVRSGPYKDGVFRFTIMLDETFPDCEHPKVVFQTQVFHPVIHPETNEMNLLGGFPTWNKNEQHLWQVLKYIQWVFSNVEASVSHGINQEACEMIAKNKEKFIIKTQQLVQQSKDHLFDTPPTEDIHYIIFEQFNPDVHKKDKMLTFAQETAKIDKKGYSWVLPRSYKPLERPLTPPTESDKKEL
ncbi:protein crossbronx homolog [Rhynchophorus ferrugineus]|uniref:protein crossbronx homolog n=1 Tax=Rhynchophorus ferrugineus TaxID=354439 RepID=UPI003FCCEDE7